MADDIFTTSPDSGSIEANEAILQRGNPSAGYNSMYSQTFGSTAEEGEIEKLENQRNNVLPNFQRIIDSSGDNLTMDFEPGSDEDPALINVLGRGMTADQVSSLDGGKQLMDLVRKSRQGPRGFREAVFDAGWKDVPFVGDVVGAAIPIREMKRVVGTLEALKRGKAVSDQDLVYARLFLADQERQGQSTKWGVLGDVVRGLPTLGAEMWAGSALFAAAASPFAGGAAATGVGAPAAAAGEAAAGLAGAITGLVKGGFRIAERAAVRKAVVKYLETGLKKSYLDFTKAAVGEGAEQFGYGKALLSGLSEITLTAIPKGLAYTGVDLAANAAINTAMGEEGLSSRNRFEKEIQGYMSGDDRLVRNAKWLALGDKFVEYYTEMAGGGLTTLGGIGLHPIKKFAGAATSRIPAVEKCRKLLEETWNQPGALADRTKELGRMDPVERAKHISTIGLWMANKMVDNNINVAKVAKVFMGTAYHGWIGEMAEERYGGFLNGMYGSNGGDPGLQQAWQQMWPSRDQLFAEAIGFAIPLGVMHATARAQSMKFFGGDGLSNDARTAHAVRSVLTRSDTLNTYDDTAAAGTSRKNDLDVAIDGIDKARQAERAVINNNSTYLQRVLRGALGLSNVLVSGDFSRLRTGNSFDYLTYNYGIRPQFVRAANEFEMEEATRVRDEMLKEATGKVSEADMTGAKYDLETIRLSDGVQKATRQFIELSISGYMGTQGKLVQRKSELNAIAAKHGLDSATFEATLRKEVDEGRVVTMDHGTGNKTIMYVTEQGKPSADETLKNVRLATLEAFAPGRIVDALEVSRHTVSKLGEAIDGVVHNEKLEAGDRLELTKLALRVGFPVTSPEKLDLLHKFILIAKGLRRGPNQATVIKLTDKAGKVNHVHAAPRQDGNFVVRPTTGGEAWFDAAFKGKDTAMPRDKMMAELASLGLSPEELGVKVVYTPHSMVVSDDAVRLLHMMQYEEGRVTDEYMAEYNRQATLAEHGDPNLQSTANYRKYVEEQRQLAIATLTSALGVTEDGLRVKIGGRSMYSFMVGGQSTPTAAYVTIPHNLSARSTNGSLVEEVLETAQKMAYYRDGKIGTHPDYQILYLGKLAARALKMHGEVKDTNPKLAAELLSVAKLLSGAETEFSNDALSKTVGSMLFGHADASLVEGSRLAFAAAWSALRVEVMKDEGTPGDVGLKTLTAGFISRYLRETQGWQLTAPLANLQMEFFPRDVQRGFDTADNEGVKGKPLFPYRDFLSLEFLRQAGEKALDEKPKEVAPVAADPRGEAQKAMDDAAHVEEAARAERAAKDKEDAKFGQLTFADAGFTSEEEAKKAHIKEAIGDESYDEFLNRKHCLKGGGAPAPKAESTGRKRRGK